MHFLDCHRGCIGEEGRGGWSQLLALRLIVGVLGCGVGDGLMRIKLVKWGFLTFDCVGESP